MKTILAAEQMNVGDVRRLHYIVAAAQSFDRGYSPTAQDVIKKAKLLWAADVQSGCWEYRPEEVS